MLLVVMFAQLIECNPHLTRTQTNSVAFKFEEMKSFERMLQKEICEKKFDWERVFVQFHVTNS